MKYTDFELLEFLEANNKEPSFKNLCILKEGIASGTIILEEEAPEEVEEEKVDETIEAPVEKTDAPTEEEIPDEEPSTPEETAEAPGPVEVTNEMPPEEMPVEGDNIPQAAAVSISIPRDGSMEIQANNKIVMADPEGNINVQLTEKFFLSKNTEFILESFLIDDCNMTLNEFQSLSEDDKVESIKEIAINLLNSVQEKLSQIDTTTADRSRGDIKQLRELEPLQDSITQLEAVIERDPNSRHEYSQALGIIIKSILYINQYSNTFKEAYRNKKTLMILKYQSLILSIISSVSYLMSTIIDYSNDSISLKSTTTNIMDFAPLQSLERFVESVDSGEFKTIIRDVTVVREFYLEVPVSTMEVVLEAGDFVSMIVDGVKNIADTLASGDGSKILNLIYKAAGIIILLFSVRDVFYTLFKMKTKVTDMVSGLKNFAAVNDGGGILNKLTSFSNKYKTDAEASSDFAKREIEDENREMLSQVKQIQYTKPIENPVIDTDKDAVSTVSQSGTANSSAQDLFGFDF